MTKYITVKLTEDQINKLLYELEEISDFWLSDTQIAFNERLYRKLEKALAQAKSL